MHGGAGSELGGASQGSVLRHLGHMHEGLIHQIASLHKLGRKITVLVLSSYMEEFNNHVDLHSGLRLAR